MNGEGEKKGVGNRRRQAGRPPMGLSPQTLPTWLLAELNRLIDSTSLTAMQIDRRLGLTAKGCRIRALNYHVSKRRKKQGRKTRRGRPPAHESRVADAADALLRFLEIVLPPEGVDRVLDQMTKLRLTTGGRTQP